MRDEPGFSLLEAMVATAMLGIVMSALFQLLLGAAASADWAKDESQAVVAGEQKMEEIRSLIAAGDPGMAASPPGALDAGADGYFDFVDAAGRVLGAGSAAPVGSRYVRRWAIVPIETAPNLLLVQVIVKPATGNGVERFAGISVVPR